MQYMVLNNHIFFFKKVDNSTVFQKFISEDKVKLYIVHKLMFLVMQISMSVRNFVEQKHLHPSPMAYSIYIYFVGHVY